MKFTKYIIASILIASSGFMGGCNDDENQLSEATLASVSTLNFEAQQVTEKIITVYADADWRAEYPEWVTVNPDSGSGTMDVTITVTDNMREGAMDNPRKAAVLFKGRTLASCSQVMVVQNGDKYRDVKEYKIGEIAALEDETILSVPNAIVTAITAAGFIVSDDKNSDNVYVLTKSTAKVGDKVTIKGSKATDAQSLVVVNCDVLNVTSSGTSVTYPNAIDITDRIDTYTSNKREYVAVSGVMNGNNVTVEGAKNALNIVDAPASLGIAALNGHKVVVKGYFGGIASPVVKILAANIEDKGVAKVIYFADDFQWMAQWADESGAGDSVAASDGQGAAPNIFDEAVVKATFLTELRENRKYAIVSTPGNATYLQKCYLKFGKTDYQAGLVLPPISNIPAGTKFNIAFDWAPMVGGTGKFDPVKIIILIQTGDSPATELPPIGHSFVDGVDKTHWLHANVLVEGVTITPETKITIRSNNWGDTQASTGSKVYRRWFIDNIEISKAE